MKGALKIGSVSQIGIYLHWTFALLIAGIIGYYLYLGSTVTAALMGIGLMLTVFVCVVLHELGHALAAAIYGVPTHDITIYPIGGVARLQRIPEEPMKEFWIAVAGPAVNAVLAVAFAAVIFFKGSTTTPMVMGEGEGGSLWATLLWLNVALVGFNLLPAFPMDGGRILRALLARRIEYARATQIAAQIGQGMAILFGFIGLLGFNPVLIFVALFVYYGAQQESQQAALRAFTRGIPVRQVMLTRFSTLSPDDTLEAAVEELLAGSDQDFPVVGGGRVVGVLTRKDLMRALAEEGREARVGDVLRAECFVVEDTAMLDEVFVRMNEVQCATVPVTRLGQLVGLLTLENVGELMMISSALQKAGRPAAVKTVLTNHGAAAR